MLRCPSTPRLLGFAAALALPLCTLPGCATSGVNAGDFNLVSVEEEWQLGRQLEADIARQLPLVNDPALERYVSQLGQRIVAQTELRQLPWRFHVVRDGEINAFNVPGGLVYVNAGLVAQAANASELAGVLAHEISHGVSRHGTERLTKQQGLSVGAGVLLGQDPGAVAQIAAQIAAGGAIAKFSRNDEREADQLGVRYMAAAGYDPEGMASMFERLMAEQQRQPGAVEQFFSTHPLTQDRIRDARRYAAAVDRSGLRRDDANFAAARQRARRYE
jgi:beta-barrel assembly-enhancing protease